jgi:chromosome segregation ATPase
MTFSNRELQDLAKVAEMFKPAQAFLKAFNGSEAAKNLAAIERAAGGKAKLDAADKLLQKAEASAAETMNVASREAGRIIQQAQAEAQTIRDHSAADLRKMHEDRAELDKGKADLKQARAELDARSTALAEGEAALESARTDLDTREANVIRREVAIQNRETELRAAAAHAKNAADDLATSLA